MTVSNKETNRRRSINTRPEPLLPDINLNAENGIREHNKMAANFPILTQTSKDVLDIL